MNQNESQIAIFAVMQTDFGGWFLFIYFLSDMSLFDDQIRGFW